MTSELQTDRYSQIVRRAGAMIGPGGKVIEVLTELFPVIDLERCPPELLALGGWRTAWGATERPTNVAQPSVSQIFNPEGSNVVAAVTQVQLQSAPGTGVQAGVQLAQIGGTPVRGVFRDARFGGNRETTLTTTHVDGGLVSAGWRMRLVSGEVLTLRDDNGIAVLTPGSGLSFITNNNNILLTMSYWWRERSAEQSELNF